MRPMLFVVDPHFKRGKKAYMSDKDDFLVMNFHELVWWWATNHFVFHEQARQCFFYWKKMTIQIGAWFCTKRHKQRYGNGGDHVVTWAPATHTQTPDLVGAVELLIFHVTMANELLRRWMDCAETLQDAKDNHKRQLRCVRARKVFPFRMSTCT